MEGLTDKRYKCFLLLAVSAILTGLTLVFSQIGLVEWITLTPLLLISRNTYVSHEIHEIHKIGCIASLAISRLSVEY